MAVPEGERLRKLLALRGAQGGLSAADEKELKGLRRRLEMEVLENADVVCSTCVGAGDPRLANFRFQHVGGGPCNGDGGGGFGGRTWVPACGWQGVGAGRTGRGGRVGPVAAVGVG